MKGVRLKIYSASAFILADFCFHLSYQQGSENPIFPDSTSWLREIIFFILFNFLSRTSYRYSLEAPWGSLYEDAKALNFLKGNLQ